MIEYYINQKKKEKEAKTHDWKTFYNLIIEENKKNNKESSNQLLLKTLLDSYSKSSIQN